MKWLQFLLKLSVTVTLIAIGSAEIHSSSASVNKTQKNSSFSISEYNHNSQNQLFAENLKSNSHLQTTESLTEPIKNHSVATVATPTAKSTGIYLVIGGIIAGIISFKPRIVRIRQNKVGIVYKKFGSPLPSNRQIALNGEMGVQIDILAPGRHFLFPSWMYGVSTEKAIEIDTDKIGIVKAKDGASLPPGKMFGKVVECDDFQDGREFINQGGQRGKQLGILRNGIYRLNTELFEVEKSMITHIHDSEIGIIEAKDGKPLPAGKSFGDAVDCNDFQDAQAFINNGGYRGKQLNILTAGEYPINREFFSIDRVDTIDIRTNEVGLVEAKDGQALPLGHNFGRVVDCDNFQDAQAFMRNGGQRGKQLAILTAGTYKINTELFRVLHIPVVNIPAGEIGLVLAQDGASKPPGQILGNAVDCNNFQDAEAFIDNGGQRGKQGAILTAGTYKINTKLFTVITSENAKKHGMKPDDLKTYTVESDKIGIVTTYDGKPLKPGNIAAPIVDGQSKFQDVKQFIDAGGYRGLQEEVLEEGSWKLNPWFVKVKQIPLTEIKAGTVGVVISNIGETVGQIEDRNTDKSRFNVVPRGYKGIEEIPLEAGKYPINTRVKSIVIVPTHEITLDWSNQDKQATDFDSNLRTLELHSKDSFIFKIEVTQVINIASENAPKMISRVGSPSAKNIKKFVEQLVNPDDAVKYSSIQNLVVRVLEPMVGNYFRNAAQDYDALDFVKKRDEIQEGATNYIKAALNGYGVEAVGTFINEVDLPDELENPVKAKQIANVEKEQLIAEQETEEERGKFNRRKKEADSQEDLIDAENKLWIVSRQTDAQKMINDEDLRVIKEKEEIEATRLKLVKQLDLTFFKETLKTLSPELYAKMETDKMWADAFSKFKFTAPTTLINGGNGNNNSDGLNALYTGEFQMQVLEMMTDRLSKRQPNNPQPDILPSGNPQPNILQPDQSNSKNLIDASSDDIREELIDASSDGVEENVFDEDEQLGEEI